MNEAFLKQIGLLLGHVKNVDSGNTGIQAATGHSHIQSYVVCFKVSVQEHDLNVDTGLNLK